MKPGALEIDYRNYFLSELAERKKKNPAYSLRAFARDLEISNQKLSQVLNGKTGLSSASAHKIAKLLDLNQKNHEIFVTLVEAKHGRSVAAKRVAKEKLNALISKDSISYIPEDVFKKFFEWYCLAIYALSGMNGFVSSVAWIAAKLKITEQKVNSALEVLLDAGLLKKSDGKFIKSTSYVAFASGEQMNESVSYFKSVLQKSIETIEHQPLHEKLLSAGMITLSPKELQYAKEKIEIFRTSLIKDLSEKERSKEQERLYCLSLQFFPLTVD